MSRFSPRSRLIYAYLGALCGALAACAGGDGGAARGQTANGNRGPGGSGTLQTDNPTELKRGQAACSPGCQDLPSAAIFDQAPGASPPPMDAARYFGAADNYSAPGPCVIEPQLSDGKLPGAMFPSNWLRPRFRWTPLPGENLWEIRITTTNQANALVAYTTQPLWKMPKDVWQGLALDSSDIPITVTIRGVAMGGSKKPSGTRGDFTIAPAEAHGKLVYWATTSSDVAPDTSKLVGFDVGDEGTVDALTIPQVGDRQILAEGGRDLRGKYSEADGVAPGAVQCIGCHVSTPDGAAVAFTDHWPWNNVLASVEQGKAGTQPDYVTPGAAKLLNQPWLGMPTLSKAHFAPGDRILISVFSPRNPNKNGVGFSDGAPYPSHGDRLAWFDLEAQFDLVPPDQTKGDVQQQLNDQISAQLGTAFGFLNLQGEQRSVAAPSFSHDGTQIAYTSADVTQDGRLSSNNQEVDIHLVPYGDRQGGAVTPLQGAAEPGVAEYYPSFSADDSLIAFNRVAKIDGAPMYYRPDGEIYVVSSKGGSALRLAANDPPACTQQKSPGIINSWPKWSPSAMPVPGLDIEFGSGPRTFYWLVFSSARAYEGQFELPKTGSSPPDTRSSQLYITAVVRDDRTGMLETYPAIYIWNQTTNTSNLTPAWDEFKIPPVNGPK